MNCVQIAHCCNKHFVWTIRTDKQRKLLLNCTRYCCTRKSVTYCYSFFFFSLPLRFVHIRLAPTKTIFISFTHRFATRAKRKVCTVAMKPPPTHSKLVHFKEFPCVAVGLWWYYYLVYVSWWDHGMPHDILSVTKCIRFTLFRLYIRSISLNDEYRIRSFFLPWH